MRVAVRAEEICHRAQRELFVGLHVVAAVQRRQPDVSMHTVEGQRHQYRRVPIHRMIRIHQAVISARTTDFHREDPLVGLYFDLVQPGARPVDDVLHSRRGHVGEVMAVRHHDGP